MSSLVYSECFDPWFPSGFVYRVVSMANFGNSAGSHGKFGCQWVINTWHKNKIFPTCVNSNKALGIYLFKTQIQSLLKIEALENRIIWNDKNKKQCILCWLYEQVHPFHMHLHATDLSGLYTHMWLCKLHLLRTFKHGSWFKLKKYLRPLLETRCLYCTKY